MMDVCILLPLTIMSGFPLHSYLQPRRIRRVVMYGPCKHYIFANSAFSRWPAWLTSRAGHRIFCL